MTTESTSGETPKKKPRKDSKVAERIAELETGYALALTEGETANAARIRARIQRLENGEPEDLPEDEGRPAHAEEAPPPTVTEALAFLRDPSGDGSTKVSHGWAGEPLRPVGGDAASDATTAPTEPAPAEPVVTWNDVVNASAEVEANRVEREIVEEVLDVKLSESDLADIARANAADDQEKTERQRQVDDLKTKLKDQKTAIDALTARMHDRNNSVLKGRQARKAKWILESVFSTNTVRYLDPVTEEVVLERPMERDERQISLPLVSDEAAAKGAQLALGDVATDDVVTDPEALLRAATEGEQDPADATLDNEPSSSDLGDDEDEDEDEGDDE